MSVLYIGLDDTDTLNTPGTNQLARHIAQLLRERFRCARIVRHQLLFDPRVPYTSKNGSASLLMFSRTLIGQPQSPSAHESGAHTSTSSGVDLDEITNELSLAVQAWSPVGSDPGLCVVDHVPPEIVEFGLRCQQELITREQAFDLAAHHGLRLRGLGGTQGGVIGALAAVGLASKGDDGRLVMWNEQPDDLSGWVSIATLHDRDVEVREHLSNHLVTRGQIDVGKRLRPNLRAHRAVLYVEVAADREAAGADRDDTCYRALKFV